jgi:hypothetical protein
MNSSFPGKTNPAAGRDLLGGFEERLLADLKLAVAQEAAAWPDSERAVTPRPTPRTRRAPRRAFRPRLIAVAAVASVVVAAGVAIALTATSGAPVSGAKGVPISGAKGAPAGGQPAAAGPAGHPAAFGPATTAAGVLHNAALAALELPAGAPRPGQFVYTKLYTTQNPNGGGVEVLQSWLSADGVQAGLTSGGTPGTTGYSPGCRGGWYYYPNDLRHTQRCQPSVNAAYFPDMPTSPGPLRAWLRRHLGGADSYASGLLTNVESMETTDYLLPRQQAALYELLAQTPGLTVVPRVTNMRGVTGIGIRSTVVDKGSIYTIIFDPRTYAPLGMNWVAVSGPFKGSRNGEVLLDIAIVNHLRQQP